MKSILCLPLLMAVAFATDGFRVPEEGCPSYKVDLEVEFYNDVAIPCTDTDFVVLNNVFHGLSEIDVIASRLAPSVPDFSVAQESFGANTVIDHTGQHTKKPDMKDIMMHMSTADELRDIQFGMEMISPDSVQDAPDAPVVATNFDSGETTINFGGFRRMNEEGSSNLRGSGLPARHSLPRGNTTWQPVASWPGMDVDTFHTEGHRRMRKVAGCDGTSRGCYSSWCCFVCGWNCRRRRSLAEAPEDDASALPSVSPSASPSADGSPSESPSGPPSKSPAPSTAPSASPSASGAPSEAPHGSPSESPSGTPSENPSGSPSKSPAPSIAPSASPSASGAPSEAPHDSPSDSPSGTPTDAPSDSPHESPSGAPSSSPTDFPTPPPTADEMLALAKTIKECEARVSAELSKQLRYLARHDICPCLGIYWKLKVSYQMNPDIRGLPEV